MRMELDTGRLDDVVNHGRDMLLFRNIREPEDRAMLSLNGSGKLWHERDRADAGGGLWGGRNENLIGDGIRSAHGHGSLVKIDVTVNVDVSCFHHAKTGIQHEEDEKTIIT